jgi:hypothetical protein
VRDVTLTEGTTTTVDFTWWSVVGLVHLYRQPVHRVEIRITDLYQLSTELSNTTSDDNCGSSSDSSGSSGGAMY